MFRYCCKIKITPDSSAVGDEIVLTNEQTNGVSDEHGIAIALKQTITNY